MARQIPKFCEASICHNVIMLGKKIAKVLSSCGRLTTIMGRQSGKITLSALLHTFHVLSFIYFLRFFMILFLRHQFLDKMVSFVAFLFLGMSLMTMKIVTGFNLYNGRSNINNILASSSSSPSSSSSSSSHYSRLFASQSIIEAESMYLEKATQSEGVLEKPDVRNQASETEINCNKICLSKKKIKM